MDRAQFDQIFTEELEKLQQEGFLDRVMAKASGKVSKLKTLGKNVGTIFQAVTQGKSGVLQNPKAAEAITTGVKRLQSYEKKLSGLFVELMSDMELMFGENFANAPQNLKQSMQKLDKNSVAFITDLSDMIRTAEKSLTAGASPQDRGEVPTAPQASNIPIGSKPAPGGAPGFNEGLITEEVLRKAIVLRLEQLKDNKDNG